MAAYTSWGEVVQAHTDYVNGWNEAKAFAGDDWGQVEDDFMQLAINEHYNNVPMHLIVTDGATLECSNGSSSSKLKVTTETTTTDGQRQASVQDHKPGENIDSFGYCDITHKSCDPQTSSPWQEVGMPSEFNGHIVLHALDTLRCDNGGEITVQDARQSNTSVSPGQSSMPPKLPMRPPSANDEEKGGSLCALLLALVMCLLALVTGMISSVLAMAGAAFGSALPSVTSDDGLFPEESVI